MTSRRDARAEVGVRLVGGGRLGATDADGLLVADTPAALLAADPKPLLVVREGTRTTLVPFGTSGWEVRRCHARPRQRRRLDGALRALDAALHRPGALPHDRRGEHLGPGPRSRHRCGAGRRGAGAALHRRRRGVHPHRAHRDHAVLAGWLRGDAAAGGRADRRLRGGAPGGRRPHRRDVVRGGGDRQAGVPPVARAGTPDLHRGRDDPPDGGRHVLRWHRGAGRARPGPRRGWLGEDVHGRPRHRRCPPHGTHQRVRRQPVERGRCDRAPRPWRGGQRRRDHAGRRLPERGGAHGRCHHHRR